MRVWCSSRAVIDPVPEMVQYRESDPPVSLRYFSCQFPPMVVGGPADSVVPVDMVTDPTQNNIFNRPVVQIVPPTPGVSILAQ